VNLEALTRDDWILSGAAVLLVIDLLFLPWFSFSLGPLGSVSFTGTDAPDGWLGGLALLASLALIADLAVDRLSPGRAFPNIRGSRTETRFVLACVAAACVVLKFVFNIHFSYFGFGFYLAIVLSAALVYVAQQIRTGSSLTGGLRGFGR
jgi:hypothetical protein